MSAYLRKPGRIVRVAWRNRDADACANDDLVTADIKGSGDGLDDAHGQRCCGLRLGCTRLHDGERVAADPRHRVGVSHAFTQALGYRPQQRVAHRMTERIVDLFEAIEIEAQHGNRAARGNQATCFLQVLAQQNPIGKIG
jgi:hypothetical protein